MPAIAGVPGFEDVAVEGLPIARALFMSTSGDVRIIVSRAIQVAIGVDGKIVQLVDLIMLDEILTVGPTGHTFSERKNHTRKHFDTVEIAGTVLN